MGKEAAKWLKAVDPHFGFLTAHGFGSRDLDDSSFWSIWVQYRSETFAVRISKSNEFVRAEVHLIRLVDGEVPPYPIWITGDRIDWRLLDNIVEARQPDLMGEVTRLRGLKSSELDEQLRFWAPVLRDLAGDFLAGDSTLALPAAHRNGTDATELVVTSINGSRTDAAAPTVIATPLDRARNSRRIGSDGVDLNALQPLYVLTS